MAVDIMPHTLDAAFSTAFLITGVIHTAETAVIDGIAACEDLSPRGILIEAVRCALGRCERPTQGVYELEWLPPELQSLFRLQPLPRHCFVLRILLNLSPQTCAELLRISGIDFEGALHAALIELLHVERSHGLGQFHG